MAGCVFAFLMRREKVGAKSHLRFTAPPHSAVSKMFPRGTNPTAFNSNLDKIAYKRSSWIERKRKKVSVIEWDEIGYAHMHIPEKCWAFFSHKYIKITKTNSIVNARLNCGRKGKKSHFARMTKPRMTLLLFRTSRNDRSINLWQTATWNSFLVDLYKLAANATWSLLPSSFHLLQGSRIDTWVVSSDHSFWWKMSSNLSSRAEHLLCCKFYKKRQRSSANVLMGDWTLLVTHQWSLCVMNKVDWMSYLVKRCKDSR